MGVKYYFCVMGGYWYFQGWYFREEELFSSRQLPGKVLREQYFMICISLPLATYSGNILEESGFGCLCSDINFFIAIHCESVENRKEIEKFHVLIDFPVRLVLVVVVSRSRAVFQPTNLDILSNEGLHHGNRCFKKVFLKVEEKPLD